MAEWYPFVYMYHNFSIHSPDSGHFVSNAAANTRMWVVVLFLSDSYPEVELLDHVKVK